MPTLDVSEVLTDSDFVDDFQVIRSGRSTSTGGLTVDVPGSYFTFGNIQPTSGATLSLMPEDERVGSFITVVTQFQLQALTSTTAPDQVVWKGLLYRVKMINDWSQYGNGFVQAVCELTVPYQMGLKELNERFALWVVNSVGTMNCAYVFAIIALIALPQAVRDSLVQGPLPIVTWLSQSFLQLTLLAVILAGQDIQSRAMQKQAKEQHDAVLEILDDVREDHAALIKLLLKSDSQAS